MFRFVQVFTGVGALAIAAVVLAPAPALAESGCTGFTGFCKRVHFEVCSPVTGCEPGYIDLAGLPSPE